MKVGFIGTGNMGKLLIDSFIQSDALSSSHMYINNRSKKKVYAIKEQYPDIHVIHTYTQLIEQVDLIFICVKPLEVHPILQSISTHIHPDQCLVSITSPISAEQLESVIPCSVARVIPSITNQALSGVSLATFGYSCSKEWQETIIRLFGHISLPLLITNDITRISSDITSCGPAFLGYILQQYIEAATTKTNISKEQATKLVSEMVIGFGELLERKLFSLPALIEKVCVKGGVTGVGIEVLSTKMNGVFEELVEATHQKYVEDIDEIKQQFQTNSIRNK